MKKIYMRKKWDLAHFQQIPIGPSKKIDNIQDYLSKRGDVLWKHRASDSGYLSGSTRYNVLKRAKYRCELCGAHESQIALHVDHSSPRSKGGPDDLSNFQALCVTCNTNKRAEDDTDFMDCIDYGSTVEELLTQQGIAADEVEELLALTDLTKLRKRQLIESGGTTSWSRTRDLLIHNQAL